MFIATFAIAGIPGFAGFFSKDEILEAARSGPNANIWLWLLGLIGAGLTSFYMFRLIFLTFFGKPRYDEHKVHVHESPRNMTVPLMILAFLSIVGGWVAAPHLIGGTDYFEKFLHPVFAHVVHAASGTAGADGATEVVEAPRNRCCCMRSPDWPVIIALVGIARRVVVLHQEPETPKKLAESVHGALHTVAAQILCGRTLQRRDHPAVALDFDKYPLARSGRRRDRRHGERRSAPSPANAGSELREIQSGNARSYATWVVIGAVGVTVLMLGLWGMVR